MHVDIASISFGENFQAGTFGESNSYPPAQVVINYLAVPSDTGTQNPTDGQYWLKISEILIPVSAGAVYNSSSICLPKRPTRWLLWLLWLQST